VVREKLSTLLLLAAAQAMEQEALLIGHQEAAAQAVCWKDQRQHRLAHCQ
jgi:hypothetical protein